MEKCLIFITENEEKVKEVQKILGQNYKIKNISINLKEYQGTVEYIAQKKCTDAAKIINNLRIDLTNICGIIIDDTSLCFNAFCSLPGPYIKYFLKNLGPHGLFKILNAFENKSASAICTIGFLKVNLKNIKDVKLFQGSIDGSIVEPRGILNFGWDSCFEPLGTLQTFAEMNIFEKSLLSHRSIALSKLKFYLNSLID